MVRQRFPNNYSTEALTSSCVVGQAWSQAPVTDPLQFPPFIGEWGKIHFSKKEAWLACAGRISAAEIGTQKTDNVDAARTRSGGRKQAPVYGMMLFLPGFKSILWNKVETVTINDLHEWVQSILEDYNLCRAGAVMVQFKAPKIRLLGDNQTSFNSGNFPVQDTPKFVCTGSIPAWGQGPWTPVETTRSQRCSDGIWHCSKWTNAR